MSTFLRMKAINLKINVPIFKPTKDEAGHSWVQKFGMGNMDEILEEIIVKKAKEGKSIRGFLEDYVATRIMQTIGIGEWLIYEEGEKHLPDKAEMTLEWGTNKEE